MSTPFGFPQARAMPRQHRNVSRASGMAAGTGGTFLGFSAYTGEDDGADSPLETVKHAYSQRPIEVFTGSDADAHVCFRLIGKTAATSQVKGLQAMAEWLERAPAVQVELALRPWLYWFQTLALSNDRHVRGACFIVHEAVVRWRVCSHSQKVSATAVCVCRSSAHRKPWPDTYQQSFQSGLWARTTLLLMSRRQLRHRS